MGMRPLVLCLAVCAAAVSAFQIPLGVPARTRASSSVIRMAGSGYASTKEGKSEKVAELKEWLKDCEMIFAVPGNGLTVAQLSTLRKSLPKTTRVTMAKNTLLRVAIKEDKRWEPVSPVLEGQNLWFFVGGDEAKVTFDAWAAFLKDNKALKDTHNFRFGAMDSSFLDTAGVEKVSKLPSKTELITKLAYALKQPSTKLARTLKASPTKLVRAIKLSFIDNEDKPAEE